MSLYVDVKKKCKDFQLHSKFEIGDETLAILGASGCGKSMTLKCIAGIETPDEGYIVLNNRILFDSEKKINVPVKMRDTGYLFQNYALFPHMTVEENISIGIKKPRREKGKLIEEKIKSFYLEGYEKHYPRQLSGGQQQRVALARVLASEPSILMLDEPFSALDSSLKWELELEIMKVLESFKGTALFVSHNRDETYRMCNKMAVMSTGKIDVIDTKHALFMNPKTLSATLLTGCKNISKAQKLSATQLKALDWDIVLQTNDPIPNDLKYIGIRAHHLEVSSPKQSLNTIGCQIVKVIEDTASIIIIFKCKDSLSKAHLYLELSKAAWYDIQQDDALYLNIPQDKIIMMT